VHTFGRKVGRLLELRSSGTTSREELQAFKSQIVAVLRTIGPDERFVMISDLRDSRAVPTELAGDILTLMRSSHSRLERAAVLLSESPIAALQARRLAEEAHFEGRKLFTDRAQAVAWLEPVLDPAERARLAQFLDGK
jgi:hypothetical protein